MRKIKFRAWDKLHESMEYIDDFYWFEESGVHYSDGLGHHGDYVLMQYTGLKDQSNNEIYEGDVILKVTTSSLFEVYYGENSACFRVKRTDGWHFDLKEIFPINDWKVVGNIYEKFDWNI
jgi:uncharacterized phage protein (TIGR01671 family)